MGPQSVEFILKQTHLSCIFSTHEYIDKLCAMKKDNLAGTIKYLVCFDEVSGEDIEKCRAVGVKLYNLDAVTKAGAEEKSSPPFKKCTESDCPIFSYTSGTTGDSKGVKLSHKNVISSASKIIRYAHLTPDEALMSYLPYPHSFE